MNFDKGVQTSFTWPWLFKMLWYRCSQQVNVLTRQVWAFKWIEITNRYQYVISGVPQGTVLRPLLFLCFSADINRTISNSYLRKIQTIQRYVKPYIILMKVHCYKLIWSYFMNRPQDGNWNLILRKLNIYGLAKLYTISRIVLMTRLLKLWTRYVTLVFIYSQTSDLLIVTMLLRRLTLL